MGQRRIAGSHALLNLAMATKDGAHYRELAQQARARGNLADAAHQNALAAIAFYEQNNEYFNLSDLSLHGLRIEEALQYLERRVDRLQGCCVDSGKVWLRIHMEGATHLEHLTDWLRRKGLRVQPKGWLRTTELHVAVPCRTRFNLDSCWCMCWLLGGLMLLMMLVPAPDASRVR